MAADATATTSDDDDDEPPHHLRCPITLALFRDPVVTSAGHSYERSALLSAWRASGKRRDPSTGEAIAASLTPNWNLRQQVQAWLDARPGVVPEGWPDRRVPRLKPDGTPEDTTPNDAAAAQPPAGGMPAPKEWMIWTALVACAVACGFAPRSASGILGLAFLCFALRVGAGPAWHAALERQDEIAEYWLLTRYQFRGMMAPALAAALCHVCGETAVMLASRLALPPALLSGDGLVAATVRFVTRMSWFRPVLWLQIGKFEFLETYAPDTNGLTFMLQLLCIAPAVDMCNAAWRLLLAGIVRVVPSLGAALAWIPLSLLAMVVAIFAVMTEEGERVAEQTHARVAIARFLHGETLAARGRARSAVLVCFFAASVLLVPIAAQAAAGACMPMPLRPLRFLFGAEVVTAGRFTALHAATSAGCGTPVLRALMPLPLSALDGADGRGATPAVLAAERGDVTALHALAEAGASLTALASSFGTPLHAAAAGDHVAAAEAVLQRVPDAVSLRDASGATPLASAVRAGAEATALLLLAYGADASPAALAAEAHSSTQSLLMLALPRPVLLDELVRARCAAIAAATSPAAAAVQLRAELARVAGELKVSAPQLPPEAARVLARLQEGATRCDGRDDA